MSWPQIIGMFFGFWRGYIWMPGGFVHEQCFNDRYMNMNMNMNMNISGPGYSQNLTITVNARAKDERPKNARATVSLLSFKTFIVFQARTGKMRPPWLTWGWVQGPGRAVITRTGDQDQDYQAQISQGGGTHQDRPVWAGGSGSGARFLRLARRAFRQGCDPQVAAWLPSVPREAVNCFPQIQHALERRCLPWFRAASLPPALGLHLTWQIRQGLLP